MAHEQMREFLRFFDSKKDVQLGEVDAIFEEFKESSIVDDIVARDDLLPMLDRLSMEIKDSVGGALTQSARMGGLVVEQVLQDGHAQGVNLSFDMSKTEDEALLAEVGRVKLSEPSKEPEIRASGFKLDSIRDEHQRLMEDTERLKAENKTLQERYAAVTRQATAALAAKNKLAEQVQELQKSSADAGAASDTIASLRARLLEKESQLERQEAEAAAHADQIARLREELNAAEERSAKAGGAAPAPKGNFHKSKQFNQLKQLLAKKNAQLTELRKRLDVYEPESVRNADEESGK